MGAMFTAQNQQIGARTKHINVKYHHVKNMLDAGELELRFVRSEHNLADLMTKNVRETIHSTLSVPLMDRTMAMAFGGCDKEDVKNVLAVGLDLGVKLANHNSSNDGCGVKVQHANKGKTVTWAHIARSKVGTALNNKLNGNKPKYKAEIVSWKSKINRGWNHGHCKG